MRLFVSMLLVTVVVMATLIDDSASASTHKRSLLDVLEEEKVSNGWKQVATHENGLPYNLLGSPMFVAPRPTDTKAIDLMCRFIQETPLLPNVEHDDEDVTAPNWDLLYADRSEDAAVCCQMEGNEQELCIEALRQKAVDQYCYFWDHSMENDLGVNEPCCEETGEGRVQCMDQARYGFDVDIHSTDRSIEILPVTVIQSVKQQLMKVNKPPAFDNNFCTWAKQQPHVDTAFEEATLQRLDPMQKISEVTRKLISCCYINGDEPTIDQCMSSVREESLDQMCLKEKVVETAVPLIDPSVITNIPAGLKAIMSYNDDIPAHPCCQRSYTNRYSCFTQEWCGFKAHRDTYDHTDEITQYSEKFEQFTSKVTANLGYSSIESSCGKWYGGKVLPESVEEIEQEEENMGECEAVAESLNKHKNVMRSAFKNLCLLVEISDPAFNKTACVDLAEKLDPKCYSFLCPLLFPGQKAKIPSYTSQTERYDPKMCDFCKTVGEGLLKMTADGISKVSGELCSKLFANDKDTQQCSDLGLFTKHALALEKFFKSYGADWICGSYGLQMCPNPGPPKCMCEKCNAFIGKLAASDPKVIQDAIMKNLCDALENEKEKEACKALMNDLVEKDTDLSGPSPLCSSFCQGGTTLPDHDPCPDTNVCDTCNAVVYLLPDIPKEDVKKEVPAVCGALFPENGDAARKCSDLVTSHVADLQKFVKTTGDAICGSDGLKMCKPEEDMQCTECRAVTDNMNAHKNVMRSSFGQLCNLIPEDQKQDKADCVALSNHWRPKSYSSLCPLLFPKCPSDISQTERDGQQDICHSCMNTVTNGLLKLTADDMKTFAPQFCKGLFPKNKHGIQAKCKHLFTKRAACFIGFLHAAGAKEICGANGWKMCPAIKSTGESETLSLMELMGAPHLGLFLEFTVQHNKTYKSTEEYVKRLHVFQDNMKRAADLQESEQGTAKYGVTKFMDLSEEEFRQYYLSPVRDLTHAEQLPKATIPDIETPDSYDWREHGAVTPVKDQGRCGAFGSFAAVANVEGLNFLNTGKLVSLAEQELVDCDEVDQGCNGGLPSRAYAEMISMGGLVSEADYPYTGREGQCNFDRSKVEVHVNGFTSVSKDEDEIAAALVNYGPLSIVLNAGPMQFYTGGIADPWFCSPSGIDHAVTLVGYGTESGNPYWLIKNSWSSLWGEEGYYRLIRGKDACGMNQMVTTAVINTK
ncbi:CTSF [Branchiostoma lanceolatum]|uniref:CTSF protein n=1 Tax=Branchiostoma lanceolatum TaxID=7740 RepID=A0A8J9VEH5_BRALA|nr:CTSF [Branchiostoma lanceolatum]